MINYGKQYLDEDDFKAVQEVLNSDFLTQGPKVELFENSIIEKVGSKYAVAVNSASSALHIACIALGLRKKDIFWTVPNTFVASATCGIHCGAQVDFVDIDKRSFNISLENLKNKLQKAEADDCLPKVLVTVHFAGQPTEQEEIYSLSKKYHFKIIEDASHSLGSKRNGKHVGDCKWSDITIFSFHPVKMITTGEGGIALTNDKSLFSKMQSLRSHGIVRNKENMKENKLPDYYYEQHHLGFNYRMNDISAALGISQLKKLDRFVNRRNQLAKNYDELLSDLPLKPQKILSNNLSSYHLYVVNIEDDYLKNKSRDNIYNQLLQAGIKTNLHYLPVHLHPFFKDMGFHKGQFPNAENYADSALSLPLYYSISDEDVSYVNKALHSIII